MNLYDKITKHVGFGFLISSLLTVGSGKLLIDGSVNAINYLKESSVLAQPSQMRQDYTSVKSKSWKAYDSMAAAIMREKSNYRDTNNSIERINEYLKAKGEQAAFEYKHDFQLRKMERDMNYFNMNSQNTFKNTLGKLWLGLSGLLIGGNMLRINRRRGFRII